MTTYISNGDGSPEAINEAMRAFDTWLSDVLPEPPELPEGAVVLTLSDGESQSQQLLLGRTIPELKHLIDHALEAEGFSVNESAWPDALPTLEEVAANERALNEAIRTGGWADPPA